jgi:hypothetical protein
MVMLMTPPTYEVWLEQVPNAPRPINMLMEDSQGVWAFDFLGEHDARPSGREGEPPLVVSAKQVPEAGLQADAQLLAAAGPPGRIPATLPEGGHGKVESPDDATGIEEWMWMIVDHTDDKTRLVFGTLDNEPVKDYSGKVELGLQLAVG